jgi:TolA-binding protein
MYPASPQAKDATLQLAQCRYNEGNVDQAIVQYKAFLDKYPQDEKAREVMELLQMAYYKQAKSGKDLRELTAQFPQSKFTADIYWELGAEAYNRKEYDKALEYFQKLILDFPGTSQALQAYYYKADAHFLKGDYKAALTHFKNFVINYPQDPLANDSRFKLAVSHFSLKDYLQSAVAFNDYMEAHPGDPKARDATLNIPLCYGKAGQIYQAIDAYNNFLKRYPQDEKEAFVYLQIGQLYEEGEDFTQAVDAYKKVPSHRPEVFEAIFSTARCYKKLKAPTEEVKAYETLRGYTPKDNKFRLAGLVNLGEIYEQNRAYPQAVEVYKDIASFSTNPEWRSVAQEKIKTLKGR